MGIFGGNFGGIGGLGEVIGGVARRVAFADWKGVRSPYGLPIPICYGVTWTSGIQVYSGPSFVIFFDAVANALTGMIAPVFTVNETTGEISIEEKQEICQSAVIVLCESAADVLDILKDGVSVNSATVDTTTERLTMISGHSQNAGVIPPTGEDAAYFHSGTGAATAHTRFDRTGTGTTAPYTYSDVARIDFCALAIGSNGSRPNLKFKVRGHLAASATVGADPVAVLEDLWTRAAMSSTLDVDTYFQAYCDDGGGSGTDQWIVNRTIDSQTSGRELIEALLDETFSTVITLETGTVQVVPLDQGDAVATALGESDFVYEGSSDPVTVKRSQDSDAYNCFPVKYQTTTVSGTHEVTNEDLVIATGSPSSYGIAGVHRAPAVSCSWVSTAEHALNLSHLLAEKSVTVRRTFGFRLVPDRHVLLQVGDTVSLTEPHLGLSSQVARIVSLSEDASGVISVEAEEWFGQVAYTTPEVDPTDGFGGTLPGNPRDPTDAAIAAMGDDGFITPSEKPQLWAHLEYLYGTFIEMNDTNWTTGDAIFWTTHFTNFFFYLGVASGIDPDPEAISANFLGILAHDTGWEDLLAGWMLTTDTIDGSTYREKYRLVTDDIHTFEVAKTAALGAPVATGSTAARSLGERFSDTVNAKDFGAVADVGYTYPNTWTPSTDDTDAVQAAIDACASSGGGTVVCPPGRYQVEGVTLKSGVLLRGERSQAPGAGTVFYSEQASGEGIVLLESGSNAMEGGGVTGIKFVAKNQGVWAVKPGTTAYVVNSVFSDLIQITSHGLDFSTYFQGCTIKRILSKGTCDQMLLLAGNWNRITDIDKEAGVECPFGGGHTGTTTEPYVEVIDHPSAGSDPQSTGNTFDGLLVEQNTSVNKPLARFAHTQHTVLSRFWPEAASATNGNAIEISDSTNFHIKGSKLVLLPTYQKLLIEDNSNVTVDVADINSEDVNLAACVSVDSSSYLHIDTLFNRRSADLRPLAGNVTIGKSVPSILLSSPDGITQPDALPPSPLMNMLLNASFESGTFGWTLSGTSVAGAVGASELLSDTNQIDVTGSGNLSVKQNARVKAGQLYTVSAWIKVTGTTDCIAVPSGPGTGSGVNRVYSGQGWIFACVTLRADSDNNYASFGVDIYGADGTTHVYIDEVMVAPGRRAVDSGLRAGDLQIGQASNVRTYGNGSSAPGSGTWRQGDIIFNSAPGDSAGVAVGWVCVAAGSPGTWRAFGVTT